MKKFLLSIVFLSMAVAGTYLAYMAWRIPAVNASDYGYNGQQDYYLYVLSADSHNYLLSDSNLMMQLIAVTNSKVTTFKFNDKTAADNVLLDWVKTKSSSGGFTLSPPSYCKYIYLFIPALAENIGDSVYDSDYFFQCHAELPSNQLRNLSLTGL